MNKILIVDDIASNRNILSETLETAGYNVAAAPDGETALNVAAAYRPNLVLLDVRMPGLSGLEVCRRLRCMDEFALTPVIFVSGKDETEDIVAGLKAGAMDYVTKPFNAEEILARVKTHLEVCRLRRDLEAKNRELEAAIEELRRESELRQAAERERDSTRETISALSEAEAAKWGLEAFVGQSRTFEEILDQIRQLQDYESATVLIQGESGTGKELVARAIHFGGVSASGPFVPVNCAAVPADLAESLFFGHVKGAFSGATSDRKGYFELANGGTLFLDEIGDMPLPLQAKLLRVLEDGVVTRVGGREGIKVSPRVLCASNIDFSDRIERGLFRKDLYFRLARFTLHVPPLRERPEDLPLLIDHFLRTFAAEMGHPEPKLTPDSLGALLSYNYPGNVRELKHVVERAVFAARGGIVTVDCLHFLDQGGEVRTSSSAAEPPAARTDVSRFEADTVSQMDQILSFLEDNDSINNTQCRELLKVDRARASYLLKRMSLLGSVTAEGNGRWMVYRPADQNTPHSS